MSSESCADHVGKHLRRLRVRAFRDRLRESLLVVPAAMLVGSIVVALVLGAIDRAYVSGQLSWTFVFAPSTASTLLGTIAGATITTAGVVFSLLVVSLQLASGQFSPRVLRGSWRDQFGQVLIGLLLSTFVFCVFALARLNPNAKQAPPLTVTFALLFALASVIFIVVYLDRISRQQYVGNIVARVAAETLALIGELPYGPHVGMRVGEPVPAPAVESLGEPFIVESPGDGWVQQISRRAIVAGAPLGGVIRLDTRVGAFLVRGGYLRLQLAQRRQHVASRGGRQLGRARRVEVIHPRMRHAQRLGSAAGPPAAVGAHLPGSPPRGCRCRYRMSLPSFRAFQWPNNRISAYYLYLKM